jgi:hypothetical protein
MNIIGFELQACGISHFDVTGKFTFNRFFDGILADHFVFVKNL